MSKCRTDACAWWDYLAGACCMASGADYLRAVSDSLEDLTQKKTAQGAANTPDGKLEKVLIGSDSTSMITENGGFVK